MSDSITFLVYLDAFRYDYVSERDTPFLYGISQKDFYARVETVSGFTQETAMMTGKYPRETDSFTWYRYSPVNSQFKWIGLLKYLSLLRKSKLYYPIKVGLRKTTSFITKDPYPDPSFIPLEILPLFENISRQLPTNIPNLSSLCRNKKRKCYEQTMIYEYVGSKKCSAVFAPVLNSIVNRDPSDLYIIHIGDLDGVGHRHGPHPHLFHQTLKEIDSWIMKLYQTTKKAQFNCNLIIASDHAMFDVLGTVDIERELNRLPLKVPSDYVYFLDSTMARFWFSSPKTKRLIERLLSKIHYGHVLSKEEKEKLHIDFKHNAYGDLMFWLDKGYMFYPNFFQTFASEETKGMHGYINDTDGGLIVHSDNTDVRQLISQNPIPLVKVFDITRALVGI